MTKPRWQDLSPPMRAGIVLLGIMQLALLGGALQDIRKRPAAEINGSKGAWAAASFLNFIGPLAYFKFGRKKIETTA